jgi:predicted dehydrogenase
MSMSRKLGRRQFIQSTSAIAVAAVMPRSIRAGRSIEKLRTAHIGVGGMGGSDLASIASHPKVEIAALCDVDADRLGQAKSKHAGAKTFSDFRAMLSDMGDSIDAVVVSTPDHTHAPAAMSAMNLGKPVYCQKPLTHEIFEARQLRLISERKKLVTQMGIQIHSSDVYRRAVQMIQSGVIGRVSHVHAWSNKNWGYDGGPFSGEHQIPKNLDWNLWIGTAAERPFVPNVYHPENWRRLIDFGTGTLGDMGVHIFDTPYAALELTAPKWARTTCREPSGIGHPTKNVVEYEFPGTRHTTDSMLWTWYDGSNAPPKPEELKLSGENKLPDTYKLPGQGSLFVGQEGVMVLPHIGEAILFPESKFKDFKRPDVANNDHYHQWVDACLGNGQTSASFSFAGPLTEALLLGVVANRFPGKQLTWDSETMKVTNLPDASPLLRRTYREGFAVANL